MIKLNLGFEPVALRNERRRLLPLAIAAFNGYGAGSKELGAVIEEKKGYRVAKEKLRRLQHGKCAYCEKLEDAFKRPVEHFRPKKLAEDFVNQRWTGVNTHYWWLTWTWSNLYFSCDECNRNGRKGNRFPIRPNTVRAAAPVGPLANPLPKAMMRMGAEQHLLVDPRLDDPLDHLQWAPVDCRLPKRIWTWTVGGLDDKGDMMIKALELEYRLDEVNLHLRGLRDQWEEIEEHIRDNRLPNARRAWDRAVGTYVDNKAQPFRGAAWWAMEALCPAVERQKYGFRHPAVPSNS